MRDDFVHDCGSNEGKAGARSSCHVPSVLILLFAFLFLLRLIDDSRFNGTVKVRYLLGEGLHENGHKELHGALDVVEAVPCWRILGGLALINEKLALNQ